MQFDVSLAAAAARTAERRARDAALPDLLNLLPTLHDVPAARADQRHAALKDAARARTRQRDDLVHGTSQSQRALEQLQRDQRSLRPGSAAGRQAQQQDQAERKAAENGPTFKAALTSARTPNSGGETQAAGNTHSAASAAQPPARPSLSATDEGPGESRPAESAPPRAAARSSAPWALKPAAALTPAPALAAQNIGGDARGAAGGSRTPLPASPANGIADAAGPPAASRGAPAPSSAAAVAGPERGPSVSGAGRTTRPAAADPEPRTNDANVERILRSIRTHAAGDRASATLRLDPPDLGSVRLHMDLRAAQLTLLVETQTPEARRLLESQLEHLRDGLEAAGIRLERAEVRLAAPPDPGPDTGGAAQSDAQDAGRQDGSAPSHDGSAGGGAATGTDAPPETDAPEALPVGLEPAAESRVNVWA